MKKVRIAVCGFGKLGRECALHLLDDATLELAGIVRRPDSLAQRLPAPFAEVPAVSHAGELRSVDAALVCVPVAFVLETAHNLLQHGIPIAECAILHGAEAAAHRAEIDRSASRHRVAAVVGAGFDPGALSLFRALFGLLVPKGHTETRWSIAKSLHHTSVARGVPGVRDALATELKDAQGELQRYLYLELSPGTDLEPVAHAIRSDPLFLVESLQIFAVPSVAQLEEEGHGVLLRRLSSGSAREHRSFLMEGRFSEPALSAQVMVAAGRALPKLARGAHTLFELPLGALLGERGEGEYL
jgi:diaminopimelate dehydrogenase